jgi:hypothetical protein
VPYRAMSDSGLRPPRVNLDQPRWDQCAYWGRARQFFTTTNTMNLFVSPAQLEAARDTVVRYRRGELGHLSEDEVWSTTCTVQCRAGVGRQAPVRLRLSPRHGGEDDPAGPHVGPGPLPSTALYTELHIAHCASHPALHTAHWPRSPARC